MRFQNASELTRRSLGRLNRPLIQGALTATTLIVATFLVRHAAQWDFMVPQDEGILLVYPDLILRGYVPYSDFAALYSPGGFYFIAGLFHAFGVSIFVERGASVFYWVLLTAAIFLIGLRVGRAIAILAVATALAYGSLFQSPGAHPHFAAFACMLFAIFFASGKVGLPALYDKGHPILAGVMAGCAGWFKQDLGVVAVLASLVSLNFFMRARLRLYLLGLSMLLGGLIVFALVAGPTSFVDSLILDTLRSAPGRVLPLQLSMDVVVVVVCAIIQTLGAAIVRSSRVPEHLVRLSRGIAALTVLLSLSLQHRFAPGDISFLGVIVVSLTLVSLRITLLHLKVDGWGLAITMASTAAAALLPVSVLHLARPNIPSGIVSWVGTGKRLVPWIKDDNTLADLLTHISAVATRGEKLFIGPRDLRFTNHNDTFIYYLLPQLEPASRYLEMNPGSVNRPDSGLAQDIQDADWLILTSRYDNFSEPNASMIPGSGAPNDIVADSFCQIARYGPWQLMRRCNKAPVGHPDIRMLRSDHTLK